MNDRKFFFLCVRVLFHCMQKKKWKKKCELHDFFILFFSTKKRRNKKTQQKQQWGFEWVHMECVVGSFTHHSHLHKINCTYIWRKKKKKKRVYTEKYHVLSRLYTRLATFYNRTIALKRYITQNIILFFAYFFFLYFFNNKNKMYRI